MGYLVFRRDTKRDNDEFAASLALYLLQPEKNFEAIDSHSHPKQVNEKSTLNQLVAYRLTMMRRGAILVIKTRLEISSDKFLVSTFGSSYIGYISGNLDKATLLKRIRLEGVLLSYDRLKFDIDHQKSALNRFSKFLSFSELEMSEFESLAENAVRPLHGWIDSHAQSTKDALKQLPPFLIRDF